jgi:hypothetical protein
MMTAEIFDDPAPLRPSVIRAHRAALASTGAEIVLLDPAVAVPQRPERLARRDAERAGD